MRSPAFSDKTSSSHESKSSRESRSSDESMTSHESKSSDDSMMSHDSSSSQDSTSFYESRSSGHVVLSRGVAPFDAPAPSEEVLQEIVERAGDPATYARFVAQGEACGWCRQPVRLVGTVIATDPATGRRSVVFDSASEPDGVLLKSCGTRRATRCPPSYPARRSTKAMPGASSQVA